MSEPVHIAAIDAGSNAVRLSVARAYSALDIEPLHNERYSLRLGEGVFLRHRFSEDIFKKGVKAFRHFKEVMDEFGVTRYRAVATSASREARNRDAFVRHIKQKAGVAPGPREHGVPTLQLSLLRERLDDILRRDVRERMKAYAVRRDRADVMGIAAITFVTLGRYLNLRSLSIPGVGIREGLLQEIAREAFSRKEPHRYNAAARQLLVGTRSFARRMEYDQRHAEHVRELSILLFDELQPVHHLPAESRVLLEAGALLHDTGHMISHRGHHKHGEYLALNGDIPGLQGRDRAVVAALVRYHNRKSVPAGHHVAYSSLNNNDQRTVRRLAAILRIAEALDHSHRQRGTNLDASFQRGAVGVQISARGDAAEDLRDANRSAERFEKEFHVRMYFRQPGPGPGRV